MARGGKKLTPEERVLWSTVARTVKPLPGRMETLLGSPADPEAPPPAPPALSPSRPSQASDIAPGLTKAMVDALAKSFKGDRSGDAPAGDKLSATPPGRRLHSIEKPVHRKLARGRLPLDGRLDLHGLDQAAAHDLLFGFLARAHAGGLRHVLVITGKGASFGSEGALRRAVPQWLSKPDFAALVSGYDWAARGHGGEGALYVRLKKSGRGA